MIQANRSPKATARAMLLTPGDFPDASWRQQWTRTRPMGTTGEDFAKRIQYKRPERFSAWRAFTGRDPQRWLWNQVLVFASSEDAVALLPTIMEKSIRNPRYKQLVIRANVKEEFFLEGFDGTWAHETLSTGSKGRTLWCLLAGAFRNIVCVTSYSALGEDAKWDDLEMLCQIQRSRILSVLGG
jgi:hypothetical protein